MNDEIIKADYEHYTENTWMVDTSGYYTEGIRSYLKADGIPDDGCDKIINNAAKVLGYCPNPESQCDSGSTGIVIGKVQSGKTSNFIALTAIAFDNGYSHVVVLGGTKKLLVTQNSDRIKEYFNGLQNVIVLNTVDHRTQLTEDSITQFINRGKKIIIVALKSPSQINFINNNIFSGDVLSEKPTLIIDDEGDEASLNGLVNKGKKTATYTAIENLKKSLKKHCFVSVTATPQANLLISTMDILSPDFGVLVDPGKGYCGLDVFHSPDSKYVIEIPDSETSLLDDGVPASFYDALSTFFVACGIFSARGRNSDDKLSMLIHPSQKKVDHNLVEKKLNSIIQNWRQLVNDTTDIAYKSLQQNLKQAYDNYENAGVNNLPSFDTVEKEAIDAIKYCGCHIVNGDSVPNGADDFYDFNIYVGGAMLGRGLTLKGLAITYIIRTAKGVSNADTVTQRARWFGYKSRYLDLCRIYAVKKIKDEFKEIREHENDLWDTVRDANLQGTRFKDIARIFLLSDNLHMTRSNVAKTDSYAFKPWNIQRKFLHDSQLSLSNISIIDTFKSKHLHEIVVKTFGDGCPYLIINGIEFESVNDELIQNFIFPSSSKFNSKIVSKLLILLKQKHIDAKIDVIWMRDGSTSKHPIDGEDIGNYMVGRRPSDYTVPAIYEGDRYQFCKNDTMQLQIHNIEDTKTGHVSPVLALYIPKQYIEQLTNLVIGSNW